MSDNRTVGRPPQKGNPIVCPKCKKERNTKSRKRYISCYVCHTSFRNPWWNGKGK